MWKFIICLLSCAIASASADYTYKTYYYEQPVDHFSFANQDTFAERYVVADQYWTVGSGPIFIYTGNEADIILFVENTGFMWDIAPEFGALLVFAEHRYYGESLPYGNSSFEDIKHLGYLRSEQALADYVELISFLKKNISGAESVPVICFGGSYGGLLSAWARIKYPHIFHGAIAASAPVRLFVDFTPCESFNQVVTRTFKNTSESFTTNVRKTWEAMNEKSVTAEGLKWLSSNFRLCQSLNTEADFIRFTTQLVFMYNNMAMADYPYPANFFKPMPAWPVKVACGFMNDSYSSDNDLLVALSNVVNFFYNYTGENPCIDFKEKPGLGYDLWLFQECTEIVFPICADGVNDMFEPFPWNFAEFSKYCYAKYNVTSHEYMAEMAYGGGNISAASNIVFSNGLLDPCIAGGIVESISDSLVAVLIEEGAHHLDLRVANPADPPSVVEARELEKFYIRKWIAAA